MNLDKADQELAHWRERLQLAAENLRDFAQLPAYQWAVSGAAAGETAARLAPIGGTMGNLHSYLDLLTGIIDRAAASRQTVSRMMPSSRTLHEIEELLEGPSITLAANPTPPEQRELLRPIQTTQAITPRQLLEAMLESFRLVRDVVLGVDAARTRVAAVIAGLEQESWRYRGAGGANPQADGALAEMAEAESKLAALKAWAGSDPLSAEAQTADFGAYLSSARDRMAAAAAQRESARAALVENKTLLAKLRQVHDRATQVDAERKLKVEEESLPITTEGSVVASIAAWLEKLEQTIGEGKFGPAGVGLARWRQEAERRLAAEEAVIRVGEAALNRRRDLIGLIDALAAKARQVGRAHDPELSALAGQAVELLRRRPTPMARARELVKEYEARLL